ncbi:MAG: hypothetical protein WCJ35_14840 [Planctomycetota bacterium]
MRLAIRFPSIAFSQTTLHGDKLAAWHIHPETTHQDRRLARSVARYVASYAFSSELAGALVPWCIPILVGQTPSKKRREHAT